MRREAEWWKPDPVVLDALFRKRDGLEVVVKVVQRRRLGVRDDPGKRHGALLLWRLFWRHARLDRLLIRLRLQIVEMVRL